MSLQVTLSQGTVVGGHYIVGSLVNSGGFGAVYQGVDTSEGNRSCAIKETYDVTPAARRQALMEASVLLTVRNQHLPEVYDAFEFNGRFYLIMQFIEGQNLLQLLKSRVPGGIVDEADPNQQSAGPCSEQEVLTWLLPIVDVLQELHSRKPPIMHRDIKPGNLILTPQHNVVLVDFGLTKLYDPARVTQTMVQAVSAGFSPLEQYVGQTSPQSDIYSMAATMYLLLTNKLPPAALSRNINDDLIAPRLLNSSISLSVERALLKALAVHADQRYQSMGEFAQALRSPAFTAYEDKTVDLALPPTPQSTVAPTVSADQLMPLYPSVPATRPASPMASPNAYMGVQPVPSLPQESEPPKKSSKKPPAKKGSHSAQPKQQPPQPYNPTYPILYPGAAVSGYAAPPQAQSMKRPSQPAQSLPDASRQGCLWGMLLGVGATLIIWFLKQEVYVYLALFLGLAGYLATGFFATRRGGSVFRGGRAGYWAGMTSLLLFGVISSIFLLVSFVQKLHLLTTEDDFYSQNVDAAVEKAWNTIQPIWPNITLLPDQSPFLNFVVTLVAFVIIAGFLGLIGGIIGARKRSAGS